MPTVTRAEFAALRGVTRQTVAGYIADGHISAPAVIGEGRALRIDADLAHRQLDERLDMTKRGGGGDDKESIRQWRAERARQAKLVREKMEREAELDTAKFVTIERYNADLWAAREAFLAMLAETHRGVSEVVKEKHPEVDRRLVEHALREGFLDVWRRWGAARPEMFGAEPVAVE